MSDSGESDDSTSSVEMREEEEDTVDGGMDAEDTVDDDIGEMGDMEEKIEQVKKGLAENPVDYELHEELVSLLRKNGDLEELGEAREAFLARFPLPSQLWIEWIEDLKSMGDTEKLASLFERAFKDFNYVSVWIECIQWACGQEASVAREKFEAAVLALGLRVDIGWAIWGSYLDLEEAFLDGVSGEDEEKQRKRVEDVYKRALRIPNMELDSTWARYEKFAKGDVDESIKTSFQSAQKTMAELSKYELALEQTDHSCEAYSEYLQWEIEGGDPARIQSFFERMVEKHQLDENVWLQYGQWMEQHLKIHTFTRRVYERAVRCCAYSIVLWQQTLLALERAGAENVDVDAHWENARQTITTAEDGAALYRTYLYLLRRRADSTDKDFTRMAHVFAQGQEELRESWPHEWDPNAQYRRNYAWFAFTKLKDYKLGHRIWEDILASGGGRLAERWLEAVRNEREFGDAETCRKMMYRALNSVSDHPHLIYEAIIQFEREEGTVEQLDKALEKVNAQAMHRASRPQSKKEPVKAKPEPKKGGRPNKDERKSVESKSNERKRPAETKGRGETPAKKANVSAAVPTSSTPVANKDSPAKKDADGFLMPGLPMKKPDAPVTNGSTPSTAPSSSTEGDKKYTVFVSNLDFKCPEDAIKEALAPGVVEVRLLYRGMSKLHKGYGYVDMDSDDNYRAALNKDRVLVDGRPMFVNQYNVTDRPKNAAFKYATGLEKNKLFVRQVHFDATAEQLKDVFSQFGTVADVRLVTHKSGKSKGVAYVDMSTEEEAARALNATDIVLLERTLSVALSNPPKKSDPNTPSDMFGIAPPPAGRKSASSMLQMVPRTARPGGPKPSSKPSGAPASKLSNDQFRALLSGGK